MSKAIPDSASQLIDAFARLPGVGPGMAARLTYNLLHMPDEVSLTLAQAIIDRKNDMRLCLTCYNFSEEDPCPICKNPNRQRSNLLVVEQPSDVDVFEQTGKYKGLYYVLHGVISPREGIGPDQLKIRELIQRVKTGTIRQIVFGFIPRMESDATVMFVKTELDKAGLSHVKLKRLLRPGNFGDHLDSVIVRK